MSFNSRNKTLIAAAVGAGVIMGAAGLFLYHNYEQKKKIKDLEQQMTRLDLSLSELQQEIVALRDFRHSSNSRSNKSKRNSFSSSRSGYETEDDMFSALDTDEDEFYDFNSDDEILLKPTDNVEIKGSEIELFQEVDGLLKGDDSDRLNAFNLLKKNEEVFNENPDFLWRLAKAYQMQATFHGAQKNLETKKKCIFEGLECATKALSLDATNADAHKWFAILVGMQGDFVPIKEKIQNGFLFQKHILLALESKPEDYSLYHLLGRFKFEVANISWVEKKIASSLFAEVPSVTYNDAIKDFLQAEDLNPTPWKENRLLLARCYIGERIYDKAIEWLHSAKELIPKTKEDEVCDIEINNLIEKYKKYKK